MATQRITQRAGWLPWFVPRRGARREADARIAQLERQLAATQDELQRSEAARAAAEAALQAAQQRYLLALRGSQDGLWEWEPERGAVQLSPRWKAMLGFDADGLDERVATWHARIHPDDRAGFVHALQRQLEADAPPFEQMLRLLHRDGRVRHVLSRAVVIRRESGLPDRVVGVDTDVTSLRRVQAVLDAVADGTDGTRGEGFFAALVEHFARALEVECAFVTECVDRPVTRVRTLGYWSASGGRRESFEFDLAGTPCEAVVQQGKVCLLPDCVAQLYPREAGFESYLGLPIVGCDGRVLGHLAFYDTRPRGEDLLVERVHRIFLARAAAEIERRQALTR